MTDVLTRAQRSRCMAAIRSTGTTPEMAVRRAAYSLGHRFRLHVEALPGKPDLVFARLRAIVFVHGCFWHQHDCSDGRMPVANRAYWRPKLDRNRLRDRASIRLLRREGWRVLVIWECQTKDTERLARRLQAFLGKTR